MADESARDATIRRQEHEIDRLWDAASSGWLSTPAAPRRPGQHHHLDHNDRLDDDHQLDPVLATTIRRVHALAGQPLPETDRAERLWRYLMDGYAPMTTLRLSPDLSLPTNGGHALPRPVAIPNPRTRRRSARLSAGLSYVATAAMIAAVLALIFLVYRNERQATVVVQETPVQAVGTPAAAEPTGWLQFKGDAARTGNVPGPGPVGDPVQLWKVQPKGESGGDTISDAPVIADGVLYIDGGDGLFALDITDGSTLWQAKAFGGTPAIDGDGIIVRSETRTETGLDIARLRRSDGGVVWTADIGGQTTSWAPAVEDGVVFIPSAPSDILALDAVTGAELWRTTVTAPASRSASFADGVVYTGLADGTLVALEATTGDLLWTASAQGASLGVPTIANGTVYLSTREGATNTFYAFDQATGAAKWTFATPSSAGFYYGSADATTVYLPGLDGVLYAVDAGTGTTRWQLQTNGELLSTPLVVGDTVFQPSTDGFLYAVDAATGQERWRFELSGRSLGSLAILDGIVYAATESGSVFAITGSDSALAAVSTPVLDASPVAATSVPVSAEFVWASGGSGTEHLRNPLSVTLSPDGQLYVTSLPGQIFIFDLDGNLLEVWGGHGEFSFTDGNFEMAMVTFAPDGSIYVLDSFNYRVKHYDRDRNLIDEFGSKGWSDGEFMAPGFLSVEPAGTLLISDLVRNDVQRFSADGTYIGMFDGTGTPEGKLRGPLGLAIDGSGRIYVVELNGGSVRVFAEDGSSLGFLDANGPDFGGLDYPSDIEIDGDGYLYVADQNNNRVVVFDPSGRYVFEWGEFGTGDGQFSSPGSTALNRGGIVYVADWHNNRIEKFKITGAFPPPVTVATPTA